ncbi:MAG: CarD family transcriptional regulator [Clostridia bacterium]|nr:CarD family transcriptional regulator [Clostridia bacterium]
MFAIGDKIVYGSEGVYVVSEYACSPIDKNDKRQFYILKPAHGPEGNVIYTPVDNERVVMRPIMTREEALAFIEQIPDVGIIEVDREKNRREKYRETMHDARGAQYVSIIKTVYQRREEFIKQKKRLPESDTEYERKAKFCLYGELSSSLDIPLAEVEGFITERICSVENQ